MNERNTKKHPQQALAPASESSPAPTTPTGPLHRPPAWTAAWHDRPPASLALHLPGLQTKLALGQPGGPAERQADQVAQHVTRAPISEPATAGPARPPAVSSGPSPVQHLLRSSGAPLDPAAHAHFEQNTGARLGEVRVHTGEQAAQSARSLGASAYTVGRDIVFDQGQYSPHSLNGRQLIAHELAHVAQQQARPQPLIQRQPAAQPPQPRMDYVFVMGQDQPGTGNPFYRLATAFYRANIPNATFVTDLRNLNDLLQYVQTNVTQPIGNLYIISHANENGTLSFGVNAGDSDNRTNVMELRSALHPSGGGASTLPQLTNQIDAQTRIRIKGCDIGRTQAMVELLDEAFGGLGTVTAPTHEQGYFEDTGLINAEQTRLVTQGVTAFTAGLGPEPPAVPPIDPALRGAERTAAQQARTAAVRARQQELDRRRQAIAAERTRLNADPEIARLSRVAGMAEELSGPMFQRPGTQLFTDAELRPQVDSLYSHLSDTQRAAIVTALVAADPRPQATQVTNGTFGQQGQRLDRHTPYRHSGYADPQTLAEANQVFATQMSAEHFTASTFTRTQGTPSNGTFTITFALTGQQRQGRELVDYRMTFTTPSVPTDDNAMAQGRAQVPNPERYTWQLNRPHATTGRTTISVVAERVITYLHHRSLNAQPNQHFNPAESDARFYATSTFAPPPPQATTQTPPNKP